MSEKTKDIIAELKGGFYDGKRIVLVGNPSSISMPKVITRTVEGLKTIDEYTKRYNYWRTKNFNSNGERIYNVE